jgi:predicted 3-demethylubiquinone-9 3-methyltransferase (glyoxalase superfamily)
VICKIKAEFWRLRLGKDRWGLSWQITPRVLTDALEAGGAEARRAFEAMMPMKKIDIATIEAARRG